jgi:hypothetical protein
LVAVPAATIALASVPLRQISPTVYQTEHCLFIIDASIPWSSPSAAYDAIYTPSGGTWPNLASYFDTLTTRFPASYFSICYIANTGASNVPNYIDRIFKATGITTPGTPGAPQSFATVDFCRYNLPGGSVGQSTLGVYDHEIGHAWGARVFGVSPAICNGHWLANSTIDCQLGDSYSDDGGTTINKIYGNPTEGFRWQRVDNLRSNDFDAFSEQALYLMGLNSRWPTAYVLNSPVYHEDRTVSYSSVDTFDQPGLIAYNGARNPDYTVAQKHFKLGFVYIARDLAEVNTVYQAVEKSADQFCNAEAVDPVAYRFQTPFLCDTRYRASADGLLSDLDGNATPTLTVTDTYLQSNDGSAIVNFVASDPDGPTPTVSVVPATACCTVVGNTVQISGLPDGTSFFTLKAVDSGGKKAFAHFVIDVRHPAATAAISTQPIGHTVTAGMSASFSVTTTGTPIAFQWYRQAALTSTWNPLSDGGAYGGATTATLTVASTTAMNGDQFLCLVSDGTGTATSSAATLTVNETPPTLATQPTDRSVSTGTSVPFSVSAGGPPATFGYFYYQWQRQAAGSGAWSDLSNGGGYSGATTATLRAVSAIAMSGDRFRCVVSNTAGLATSNEVTLTVGSMPSITTQPTPVTVLAGQNATFFVVASGTAPLSYQWSRYGVPVPGATNATLAISNAQAASSGAYTVVVTNAFGAAYSNVGSLVVTASAPYNLRVSVQVN